MPSPKQRHMTARNLQTRDEIWPDAGREVWDRKENKGFTTIPRILPLILRLISSLHAPSNAKSGNPSRVYLDLWCRVFDEGYLKVVDEVDLAYSSGYTGKRAKRTWTDHVKVLIELGFLKGEKRGGRDFGFLLIVDPYLVVEKLRAEGQIDNDWWNAFLARVQEIGAELPSKKKLKSDPVAEKPTRTNATAPKKRIASKRSN